MNTKDKISSAKIKIMLRYPFLGSILFNSPLIESNDIATAATDGKRIMYNPQFVEGLDVSQLIFLFAHECLHVAFMHAYRRLERDHSRWNSACDIIINRILIEDHIGTFIEGGLDDPEKYKAGKETAEGVYALMEKNEDNSQGHDEILSPSNDNGQPMTNDQIKQAMEETKILVAQAAQTARTSSASSDTANLKRLIDEILNPKVDWRAVLNNFMVRCRDDIRSYARPNRRFAMQDLIVPSPDGEAMDDIVVAVDCSGSIGRKELSAFGAEIRGICNEVAPKNVHVMYFDHAICHIDSFPRGEPPVIEPHGGGGTAFSPIFRKVDELDLNPACCVVLTDMYCSDFGPEPDYPVLWVSTSRETNRPWGDLTQLTL